MSFVIIVGQFVSMCLFFNQLVAYFVGWSVEVVGDFLIIDSQFVSMRLLYS